MNGLVFSEAPDYGRVTYLAMKIIQQIFPNVNFFFAVRAETRKIIVIAEFSDATKSQRKISATSRARGPIPANAKPKPPFGGGRGHFRWRENSAMTAI